MALEISYLPPEVLTQIFEFLNINDRLKASRVCKTWLNILNCRRLLSDIEVKLNEAMDKDINLIYNMTRKFEWFTFYKTTIGNSAIKFLKQYDTQFVNLSFVACHTSYDKNIDIFNCQILHCQNLKSLLVQNSDVLVLFDSLPNVSKLELKFKNSLTDFILCQLNKSVFKLEILLLDSDIYCYEVNESVYENEEAMQRNPSNECLSFPSIKKLIENSKNTLKYIDFTELKISQTDFYAISEIEGLKLRRVAFPIQLQCNYTRKFCENQVSLTSLDFCSIEEVANETVRAVCKCLPNLQDLYVDASQLIDNCVIEIFQLESLETLDLDCCFNISELSFREAVSKLKTFKLKHLNLLGTEISDESLFELLKRNQNLRYLNISETSVSNKTLSMICKNLIHLKYLLLESCNEISDAGFTGELNSCSDTSSPTPLFNLKDLRLLDIRYIPSITKVACLKAIRFPRLESLLLTESGSMILDDDFEIQLKRQNPCLQNYDVYSLEMGG